FQAEDGIRDRNVTGVQTCALPICGNAHSLNDMYDHAGSSLFCNNNLNINTVYRITKNEMTVIYAGSCANIWVSAALNISASTNPTFSPPIFSICSIYQLLNVENVSDSGLMTPMNTSMFKPPTTLSINAKVP